jgi:CO/xanthine dehydrogenase Mo-binding subunit
VRLRWSRAAEFQTAPMGAAMSTRARVWLAEGRIAAMAISVTSPPHATRPLMGGAPFLRSGALLSEPHPFRADPPDLPANRGGGAARNAVPIYAAPALVERKLVTGLPWRTSSLRGLGAHVNVMAIETAVEAALMEAEIDPFEGRLASLDDPRARAVLTRLREMSGAIMADADGETRGWGIALARYKNTAAWAAVMTEVVLENELRVPRVTVAVDMGEVVHPDGARNQIEGGIVQALSWTLKEAVTLDGPRVATAGWEDYPILRFSEVPEIETALIARPGDPPLGCAEAVAGPVSAAVANAVMRLTGVPVTALPLTRDAIIAAVSAA